MIQKKSIKGTFHDLLWGGAPWLQSLKSKPFRLHLCRWRGTNEMSMPAASSQSMKGIRSEGFESERSSITVFLALSFVLISALLLTIGESARTISQRLYLQTALDSAMESLFSQFHRPLWENYRIFGLEYRADGDLVQELKDFMEPYCEAKNLFPVKIQEEDILLSEEAPLTEDIYFEEEVLEYMKFGLVSSLIRFAGSDFDEGSLSEELGSVFKKSQECAEIQKMQKEYQLDSRDLEDVEKAISEISLYCAKEEEAFEDASIALSTESAWRFYDACDNLINSLEMIEKNVEDFSAAADALKDEVDSLRSDFESRRESLGEMGAQAIDSEIQEYERYVSGNGDIREKIEAMPDLCATLSGNVQEIRTSVENFETWLEEAMMEAEEDEDDDDDDDDDDFLSEIRQFYNDIHETWLHLELVRYNGATSSINSQNKSLLEGLRDLAGGNLLSLVLPEEKGLPDQSAINDTAVPYPTGSEANPVEIAILGEYAMNFFHYYHRNDSADGSLPPSGQKSLELEYILCGESSDHDNLAEFTTRLITLREGLNLIFLFTNSAKRHEAEAFVTSFLCATANPVLISVFTLFVLGIWALGQAIQDVRTLLCDGKVPIFHTEQSWSMDVSGLFALAKGEGIGENKKSQGLSYRDYLRAFLFGQGLLQQPAVNGRMLSRIERSLRSGEADGIENFSISNCLYALHASCDVSSTHLLLNQGIVRAAAGNIPSPNYSFTVDSFYKYKNDTH